MEEHGPTRGAERLTATEWRARPSVAAAVRLFAFAVPLVAGVLAARIAAPVLTEPTGAPRTVLFLLEAAAVATVAATSTDRLTRRLLPLAALFRLSLVFPDEAPSRFKVALRAGSTKRIARGIQAAESEVHVDRSAVEAAAIVLEMVAALGRHDRLTRGHTERVRAFSDLIAEEMGLSRHDRDMLRWAVLVHDIGKLDVPAEVLNKKGRLTDEEWAVLKRHPEVGGRLVEPLAGWLGPWRLAASEHHERFDGAGYPRGLSGTDISVAGRIVAVADAYDVITSARSYKRPMSAEAARAELVRCAGGQFDPAVVRAMLNVSLGKLRLAGGPLGALGNVPLLAKAPGVAPAVASGSMVAASAVVATVLSFGSVSPAESFDPAAVAAARLELTTTVDGQASTPSDLATIGSRGVAAASTTTSTSTTTTTARPTDGISPVSSDPVTTVNRSAPPSRSIPVTTTSAAAASSGRPVTTAAPVQTPTLPPAPPPTTTTAAPTTTAAVPSPPSGNSPLVQPDSYTVRADKDEHLEVLVNDAPFSGALDEGSLTIISPPAFAKNFRVHDDHLHYRSLKTFVGVDTLTYRVCDTSGACATATVTISVTP